MIIYLIASKPHISGSNGFVPFSEQTYYEMIERGEIKEIVSVNQYD